jgi:hypothetical protein
MALEGVGGSTPFVIDIQAAFDRYIASQNKVWAHDRTQTLGASESFNCLRQLGFEKRGKEFGVAPDEDYENPWGATHRGNLIENYFVAPALEQELPNIGIDLLFAGDTQETLIKGRNSSTPDGLIVDIPHGPVVIKVRNEEIVIPMVDTGCIGLEIKSIDPRSTLAEEKTKHHCQSQIGLGLINDLTEWKPKHWLILYFDASFLDKITPFVVDYDPSFYKIAQDRAKAVYSATDILNLPPEGKFDGSCERCRWTGACGAAILAAHSRTSEKYTDVDVTALDPVIRDFLAKKDAADIAEEEFEKAKQAVKDHLLARNLRKCASDEWSVSWSAQKGKTSVDLKAVRAAGIDLTPFEKTGQGFDKLLVTPRKPKVPKS